MSINTRQLFVLIPLVLQCVCVSDAAAAWGVMDNDRDGIFDHVDKDDDNDGQLDEHEILCGSDALDNTSFSPDDDGDNIPDCVDLDADNDGDGDC